MARSIRSYQREIKGLREALESVQWVQPAYNGHPSCSGCGAMEHMHNADCWLTKLLARAEKRKKK